jgi:hypothetical protein
VVSWNFNAGSFEFLETRHVVLENSNNLGCIWSHDHELSGNVMALENDTSSVCCSMDDG